MPEKIGKYQIVERVGRGGMGMIFKAHDPVLDRSVALKVISPDIEITDELRARFYREAQACARMSHPNIVTIYDMGEDDGRLYIVMELLEGDELKRLVAQRKALPLEDKLSIMVQVCDGLHYAHQKGIVHRDIKPGNIFVQRSGQAKILDFGIAQIANTEGGLTRTGLIMGTLRYISPEQVRGRVDRRSDIYSVGAVFYEFLSLRPPFGGEDPMHLLEQLRTEEPVPLDQLDPGIPADLAAAVAKALRKDPAERFNDLEQMRFHLEAIQRGLAEEAQRLGVRVRDQRGQLLQLRAAVVERLGPSVESEEIPSITERARLETVQALERDFAGRIEAMRSQLACADRLAPSLQRATELLRGGEWADAVAEFEAIIAEMPEHARALEGLGEARAKVEAERRRQLAAQLLQDARAALNEGAHTLCVEILKQAVDTTPPAGVLEEITALQQTAEAALAAREAVRRARLQAEGKRAEMTQARRAAQMQAEPRYGPALWTEAENTSAQATAAFAREAYAEARQAFETAIGVYRRFEEAAREAQRRELATTDRARKAAAQGRQQAQADDAPQYARELWDAAEAKAAEADAALGQKAIGSAAEISNDALDLYRRAGEAAREAQRRAREAAEHAREQMGQARRAAEAQGGSRYAVEQWSEAEAKSAEAATALAREAYGEAREAFVAAALVYRRTEAAAHATQEREAALQARARAGQVREQATGAEGVRYAPELWGAAEAKFAEAEAAERSKEGEAAIAQGECARAATSFAEAQALFERAERAVLEARDREREHAEHKRQGMAESRRSALAWDAASHAASEWNEAETSAASGEASFAQEVYADASVAFDRSVALYRRAEQQARDVVRALEIARADAEKSRDAAAAARAAATDVRAPKHAPEPWRAGESIETRAGIALSERQYAAARALFIEARRQYAAASHAAGIAAEAESRRADAMVNDDAPTVLTEAGQLADGSTVLTVARPVGAEVSPAPVEVAPDRPAPREGPGWSSPPPVPREAPRSRSRLGAAAAVVGVVAAIGLVAMLWLFRTPTPVPAPVPSPTPAVVVPPAPDPGRILAEDLQKQVTAARGEAEGADAERLASKQLTAANDRSREAEAALGRGDWTSAQQRYREALEGYGLAKAEAITARAAQLEAGARAAENRAAEARRAADQAGASKRERTLWAEAGAAQEKAEDAIRQRAFDQAQAFFADAEKAYREAAKAATDSMAADQRKREEARQAYAVAAQEAQRVVQRQQSEAQQARDRMTAARRAAEQAEAPEYAPRLLASAQTRERDGQAALGRSDYGQAAKLFSDAQSDYQSAARDADAERRRVSGVKAAADQSRSRMLSRKDEAEKAEAIRLAKDLFDAGQAKQAEADGLMNRQNFAAAGPIYQDAGEKYAEAASRARGLHEAKSLADGARTRMLAEKQQANPAASDFTNGVAEERQGSALYERLAFREAAEKFKSAETSFIRAIVKTPPAPPPAAPPAKVEPAPPARPPTPRRPAPPSF